MPLPLPLLHLGQLGESMWHCFRLPSPLRQFTAETGSDKRYDGMTRCAVFAHLMLMVLAVPAAWAWDADSPLALSGFGTVGAASVSKRDIEYRRSIDQSEGVVGGQTSVALDTVFGAQVNAVLGDRAEAVIQAVSRQGPEGDWNPRVTWAYLRYSPNDDLDLRIGRLGLDLLLFSDTRLVGYSYLPIRPVPEVMGLSSVDYIDGADLEMRRRLGDGIATLKLYAAVSRGQFSRDGMAVDQARANFGAIVGGYAIGGLQLRVWLGRAQLVDDGGLSPLLAAFRSAGTAYARALAKQLQLKGVNYNYAAVAGMYSDGPFQLQSGLVRVGPNKDNPILPDLSGAYLIAGYRQGSLTPYFTYAWAHGTPHKLVTDSSGAPLSAALAKIAQSNAVDGVQIDQRTLGFGLRYDVAQNVDLKCQLDWVKAGNTRLVQDRAHPGQAPGNFMVFSATLDFVF
jgi:hypothetical protein